MGARGLTRTVPGARPSGALRASKSAFLPLCRTPLAALAGAPTPSEQESNPDIKSGRFPTFVNLYSCQYDFHGVPLHRSPGSPLAGIIDIDNLMELLRIRKALKDHEDRT